MMETQKFVVWRQTKMLKHDLTLLDYFRFNKILN